MSIAILPIMLVQFAMQVAAILVALFIWDRFRMRGWKLRKIEEGTGMDRKELEPAVRLELTTC